jgi:hypothetical protein
MNEAEAREALVKLQQLLAEHWPAPQIERTLDLCEQAGIEPLGIGGRRVVFLLDEDRVAKLAWRAPGQIDNEIEWLLWSGADTGLRELLCPALELAEGQILIQARCLPIASEALPEAPELIRRLARAGISDAAVNLGIYEGRTVCYDYCLTRPELSRRLLSG